MLLYLRDHRSAITPLEREASPGSAGWAGTKKGKRAKTALSTAPSPPSIPTTSSPTASTTPSPTTKSPDRQTDTNTQAKNSEVSVNIDSTAKSTSMAPLDAQGQFEELLGKRSCSLTRAPSRHENAAASVGDGSSSDFGVASTIRKRSPAVPPAAGIFVLWRDSGGILSRHFHGKSSTRT